MLDFIYEKKKGKCGILLLYTGETTSALGRTICYMFVYKNNNGAADSSHCY